MNLPDETLAALYRQLQKAYQRYKARNCCRTRRRCDGIRSRKMISWCLSLDDFASLVVKPCFYCGRLPSDLGKVFHGIDRVASDMDYTVDNCVTCCGQCNMLKGSRNVADFLRLVYQIAKHQKNQAKDNADIADFGHLFSPHLDDILAARKEYLSL